MLNQEKVGTMRIHMWRTLGFFSILCGVWSELLVAEEWPQFRGPNASGIAESSVPELFSETQNLRWKTALPGAGSSSPIVWGDSVFVTCYSGYGVPGEPIGDPSKLARHLVCILRTDGSIRWTRSINDNQTEDAYEGFLTEHGYASNTPVTDGKSVFAFFGKAGVVAFDFEGKELWRVAVGKESSNRRWGSGSSLILHADKVIVNCAEESQSIRALDKKTGLEIWKSQAASLELAYTTPSIVSLADGSQELVVAVPQEVWGLDLQTGKLRWFCQTSLSGNVSPTIQVNAQTLYAFGGRPVASIAMTAGGVGDVTQANVLWNGRSSSYVGTPLLYNEHLYWIDDRGQAFCISAKTGEDVYRERVAEIKSGGRPVYASPVFSNERIYVVTRYDGVLVLPAKPRFEVLAQNRFESDTSDFSATPAISNGELFVRSNRFLYCVSEQTE